MHRRTRRTLWILAAVLLILAVAVFLRYKAPPEAARLLPESQGILYFNLKPAHVFLHKDLHPVAYSMVLVGNLTGKRLNIWLAAHSTASESYAGHTIYTVPSDGRSVRVAQIGYDMVAISNTPTTEQIHSMLDRHRSAALPFAGSTLLTHHYHEVPLLSLAWGIGQIGLPFSESGAIHIFGFALPLEDDSTIVASVTPALSLGGALNIRIEEIAATDEVAASQSASVATLVTLARGFTLPLAANGANNGLKQLLKTAEVTQKRNRVIITATLSPSLIASLAQGENSPESAPQSTPPAPK
jgi:hypothetical protein